jgi:signal transduction histidine kinase
MVNQIAHALRNPIFAAMVQAEALVLRAGHDESISNSVAMVHRQLKRLEANLDEMLLFGRPTHLNIRQTDLGTLINGIIESFHSGMMGEPAEVTATSTLLSIEIRTDPDAVKTILERLICNAVQHTEAPHAIALGMELPGAETVHLTVKDTGKGISDEILEQIFLPFFPQHSGRPGLGLSVASKYAHALGGYIEVQSAEGEGTLARCVLPLKPPSTES